MQDTSWHTSTMTFYINASVHLYVYLGVYVYVVGLNMQTCCMQLAPINAQTRKYMNTRSIYKVFP